MSKSSRRAQKKLSQERSSRQAIERAAARTWPVVEAYAPLLDVWQATGCGAAAVVRVAPDGRAAVALFRMELLGGGLLMSMASVAADVAEAREVIHLAREERIPMTAAPVERAALFAWGAFALSSELGLEFGSDLEQALAFLPRPPGASVAQLREVLVGPGGPTPSALLAVARRNFKLELVGEAQEQLILTRMTLRGVTRADAERALARSGPAFSAVGEGVFSWTREYPKNHWSPLAASGGRQVLGSIELSPGGDLVAEAGTLSNAAGLAMRLKSLLGPGVEVAEAAWSDVVESPYEDTIPNP